MKTLTALFTVCLLLFGMNGVAGAVSINYLYNTNGNEFVSPYAGVTTENFESSLAWTWTGNFIVLTGDVSGVASAPFGVSTKDTSSYVSVPENVNSIPQSATITNLGGTFNYLGLWWGSVDTYNTLSFYNNSALVASFTGTAITSPNAANGNQTAPSTNLYVNFLYLPDFDSFMMTSTQYAFEADNMAVGRVPEPGILILLGLSMMSIAGLRRWWKA